MHTITITDDLYNDLKMYCSLNNYKISNFCNDIIKKALIEAKYGDIPFGKLTHDIPPRPIAEEIIPVMPMNEPNGVALLPKIDEMSKFNEKIEKSRQESGQNVSISTQKIESRQESGQNVQTTEKKEEIKTKTKKIRILK